MYSVTSPPILVAGRSYGSMGDASSCSADQQWDANCTYNGIKGQCVPSGTVGKNAACTYESSPGIVSQIGSFLGGLLGGAVKNATTPAPPAPTTVIQPASTMPSWVMPAAIGGAVLVAVVLLKKRKNPARRRRHRR